MPPAPTWLRQNCATIEEVKRAYYQLHYVESALRVTSDSRALSLTRWKLRRSAIRRVTPANRTCCGSPLN